MNNKNNNDTNENGFKMKMIIAIMIHVYGYVSRVYLHGWFVKNVFNHVVCVVYV